jgi:hypothetical protein
MTDLATCVKTNELTNDYELYCHFKSDTRQCHESMTVLSPAIFCYYHPKV